MVRPRPSHRRMVWVVAGLCAAALVLVLFGWLYVRGGGPVPPPLAFLRPAATDPLGPSAPHEQVLRTLRLLGVDRAVVGSNRGTAVVRLEVPAADSSADITAAWEGGLAALRIAYPEAKRYVVQVFGPDALPLVEFAWEGEEARGTNDPAQLRASADITMLGGDE